MAPPGSGRGKDAIPAVQDAPLQLCVVQGERMGRREGGGRGCVVVLLAAQHIQRDRLISQQLARAHSELGPKLVQPRSASAPVVGGRGDAVDVEMASHGSGGHGIDERATGNARRARHTLGDGHDRHPDVEPEIVGVPVDLDLELVLGKLARGRRRADEEERPGDSLNGTVTVQEGKGRSPAQPHPHPPPRAPVAPVDPSR